MEQWERLQNYNGRRRDLPRPFGYGAELGRRRPFIQRCDLAPLSRPLVPLKGPHWRPNYAPGRRPTAALGPTLKSANLTSEGPPRPVYLAANLCASLPSLPLAAHFSLNFHSTRRQLSISGRLNGQVALRPTTTTTRETYPHFQRLHQRGPGSSLRAPSLSLSLGLSLSYHRNLPESRAPTEGRPRAPLDSWFAYPRLLVQRRSHVRAHLSPLLPVALGLVQLSFWFCWVQLSSLAWSRLSRAEPSRAEPSRRANRPTLATRIWPTENRAGALRGQPAQLGATRASSKVYKVPFGQLSRPLA